MTQQEKSRGSWPRRPVSRKHPGMLIKSSPSTQDGSAAGVAGLGLETASLGLALLGEMLIASPRFWAEVRSQSYGMACAAASHQLQANWGSALGSWAMMVVIPVGHLVVLHLVRCTVSFDVVMETNFSSPNTYNQRGAFLAHLTEVTKLTAKSLNLNLLTALSERPLWCW